MSHRPSSRDEDSALVPDATVSFSAPASVTVLVVDDNEHFRAAVTDVVRATEGFMALPAAASRAEVIARFDSPAARRPDLVLLDVHLGADSGIEVARLIRDRSRRTRVILISTADREDLPRSVTECGADGFLPKSLLSTSALNEAWLGSYDW